MKRKICSLTICVLGIATVVLGQVGYVTAEDPSNQIAQTPSHTPSPTPTQITPSALTNDGCEPNENREQACLMAVGQPIGANFSPPFGTGVDQDLYRINVKPGIEYVCYITRMSSENDTKITIFDLNGEQIGFNDDRETGDFASEVVVRPSYTGEMFVQVESVIPIRPEEADRYVYEVVCDLMIIPTHTPTPTPVTPSALTKDGCEPNESQEQACLMAIGQPIGANFSPPFGTSVDRDLYRINVKPGIEYACYITRMSPENDMKITILDLNGEQIGFNDDRETGNFASEVVVRPSYTGEMFVQVESVIPIRPEEADRYVYEVVCDSMVISTSTPSPTTTRTPLPLGDGCELNETRATACLLPLNEEHAYDFMPAYGDGIDLDYFRIWTKPNVRYTCATSIPSDNITDTKMTIFDQSGSLIDSNDDRAPDDNGSEIQFETTEQGYVYVLVESSNTQANVDEAETFFSYYFICRDDPHTPTPTITPMHTPLYTPTPTNTPSSIAESAMTELVWLPLILRQ